MINYAGDTLYYQLPKKITYITTSSYIQTKHHVKFHYFSLVRTCYQKA